MLSPAKLLTLSNRVYCLLLYLYPTPFRREFGRDMAQVFRDDTQQTLQECGLIGFLSLWLTIVIDLNKTAIAEHLWEVLHKPQYKYVRWSGVAATIGGVVWLMPWFLPWTGWLGEISETDQLWMSLPGLILVAVGLAGLHLRLRASGSRMSAPAFGLALIGLILVISPVVVALVIGPAGTGGPFLLVIAGVICLVLGLVIMGAITLSRQALGALSFVPLVLAGGYVASLISIWLGQSNPSLKFLIPIFITLDMLCWLLLGVALLFRSQKMTNNTLRT